ncbi:MAG: hypothetical protein EOO46_06710 [Flavobacterium sp.]|nr:MAG: hypothetical protein EOO46_06710 [Flavobacterium sp.]
MRNGTFDYNQPNTIAMILTILLATISSTTLMTILSYLFSATFRELYKEPLLLKYLMQRFGSPLSANSEEMVGWVAHYAIGLLFVLCFQILLHFDILSISWTSGLLFGTAAGLIGIGWWHTMFQLSNFPPIDFKGYYWQLLVVHIIFGLTTAAVYKVLA